jgi:hypothetical protein
MASSYNEDVKHNIVTILSLHYVSAANSGSIACPDPSLKASNTPADSKICVAARIMNCLACSRLMGASGVDRGRQAPPEEAGSCRSDGSGVGGTGDQNRPCLLPECRLC